MRRNKRIAAVFKEAKLIEKYGSGIKRVQEEFKSYGLKAPLFEDIQHGFPLVIIRGQHEKGSGSINLTIFVNTTLLQEKGLTV